MSKLAAPIAIEIKKEWLKSGYFVYAVIIKHGSKTYLYIGQTGDSFHPTARGPLYRISGHLSKTRSSDQNQIIKGFRKHIFKDHSIQDDDNNHQLELALSNSTINYYFWKIQDFVFGSDDVDINSREQKRKETQFIEHYLIWKFQENKNIPLFNDKVRNEISDSNKRYFSKEEATRLKKQTESIFEYLGGMGYE